MDASLLSSVIFSTCLQSFLLSVSAPHPLEGCVWLLSDTTQIRTLLYILLTALFISFSICCGLTVLFRFDFESETQNVCFSVKLSIPPGSPTSFYMMEMPRFII